LPLDEAAGAKTGEQPEKICVFTVYDVRADVDVITGGYMAPAARAPAEFRSRFQHCDPKPGVR